MRRFLCCSAPRWGLTLLGISAAALAAAAYPLGLDNNPVMGPRRLLLLLVGIGLVLLVHRDRVATLLCRSGPRPVDLAETGVSARVETAPLSERIRRDPPFSPWPALALLLPAVFSFYLWLGTAGEWTRQPPETTFYYDMLADAFLVGQTYLQQEPDPRLALIPNPADPTGIPRCRPGRIGPNCYLLDASYFDGKYYLYWGPAPAVLLAGLKSAGWGKFGDVNLALFSAAALFILLTVCLVHLWHRYFAGLPRWLILPPFLLAGLAYPLPWVLDAPRIYEAAILSGSAFLLAGLAVALPVLANGERKPLRLAATGILWSLAFASRAVLAAPIAVLVGAIAWRLLRKKSLASGRISLAIPLAALTIPLAASAVLIGLYNITRFSSPFEFGWRYGLGAPAGQSAGTSAAFHWGNLAANTYHYLLAPAAISEEFPYIKPRLAANAISVGSLGPIPIPHPELFYGEYVTGLLISTPFLLFAGYLFWWLICSPEDCAGGRRRDLAAEIPDLADLRALSGILLAASLAGFLPILSVYAVSARYLLDVSPLLVILAGLGSWVAYTAARTREARWLVSIMIIVAVLTSGVVSVLLAFTGGW